MNRLRFTAIAAAICLASGAGTFDSQTAHAASITIGAFDRGWYDHTGFHNPSNSNIAAGRSVISTVFNNWFAFDLSLLDGHTVTSATLAISGGFYTTPHQEETYGLFNYDGNIDNLIAGTGGVAAFNGLGSGIAYGETQVSTPGSTGNMPDVSVILLMAMISDINAAIGSTDQRFVIGGTLLSLVTGDFTQLLFATSSAAQTHLVLEITPIPLPAALPLFLAALAGLGLIGWRRNRRAGQV